MSENLNGDNQDKPEPRLTPQIQLEQEPQPEIRTYSDEYKEGVAKLINDVYENEMGQHSESS